MLRSRIFRRYPRLPPAPPRYPVSSPAPGSGRAFHLNLGKGCLSRSLKTCRSPCMNFGLSVPVGPNLSSALSLLSILGRSLVLRTRWILGLRLPDRDPLRQRRDLKDNSPIGRI